MRFRSKLSLLIAITAGVGCAVTFGPGDYTGGGGDAGADVSASDVVTADGTTTLPDGAPAPSGLHLLVVAGERDGADPSTSDVWLAPIDAKGDVGVFQPLQPALFRGSLVTSTVAGGRLFIASRVAGRSVQHVELDAGIAGSWKGQAITSPSFSNFGQVFSGTSLLALGGSGSVSDGDGGSTFVIDDAIRITPFDAGGPDGGGFEAMTTSETKLPIGLQNPMTVEYKDFIYIVGGSSTAGDQASKVYVARRDAVKGVLPFAETTRVVNPQTNQPHTPSSPILCAAEGRMYLAGGSSTDIVLTSAINETDGTLGAWKAATKLPGPLRSAGCAVWSGALHFIGGVGLTSRTDRIIRAPINPDGTLGEWDLSSGEKLPAPRSSIVAITY